MLKLHIFSAFFISIVSFAPLNFDGMEDVTSCLKDFYQAAYSGEYSCTKEYDFFSNDAVTQKDAYTLGKDCALSIVHGYCSKTQYTLFTENYDQIAETITEKPENKESCIDLHYTYNSQKCTPMMEDFSQKAIMIALDKPEKNDPVLLNVIDLCHRVQTCMSPTCYYPEETKKSMNESCESMQMLNSPFADCLAKLEIYLPQTWKYPCLDGLDFNASEIETGIEMLTVYKRCTRKIMEDNCEEEAVENFDKYAEITLDGMRKMEAFANDPATQKDAYTLGKYCFLSVIHDECSKPHWSLFSKHYDQIAETITEEPKDGASCADLHYTYSAQKCTPMMKDFGQRAMAIAFDKPKMNDPKLLNIIELCGDIQTCMSPTCYYPEESKRQVNTSCEAFQMLNSPFSDCMTSLQTHPPRSSKYSCLHGRDFNAPGIETGIEMLTIYKKCTKEIMRASCGDEAVENFDVYAKISVDALQKMKAMTGSFYG